MKFEERTSNILLFPLCDKSGVMLRALEPLAPNERDIHEGSRPDAIVFAWLLDLPSELDSAAAATAVLTVTRPRVKSLSRYQRAVIHELAKLMRCEDTEWTSLPSQRSRLNSKKARRTRSFFSGLSSLPGNSADRGRNRLKDGRGNPGTSRPIVSKKVKKLVCLSGGLDNKTSIPDGKKPADSGLLEPMSD